MTLPTGLSNPSNHVQTNLSMVPSRRDAAVVQIVTTKKNVNVMTSGHFRSLYLVAYNLQVRQYRENLRVYECSLTLWEC